MTDHLKLKCASKCWILHGISVFSAQLATCQILFQKRSQLLKYLGRVALEEVNLPFLSGDIAAFLLVTSRAELLSVSSKNLEIGDLSAPISNPETNGLASNDH